MGHGVDVLGWGVAAYAAAAAEDEAGVVFGLLDEAAGELVDFFGGFLDEGGGVEVAFDGHSGADGLEGAVEGDGPIEFEGVAA